MRRLLSILVRTLACLLLAVILALGLVQTKPGKRWLAAVVADQVGRHAGIDLRIEGLGGWIPARLHVERVELGDGEGPWLEFDDLRCACSVGDLLKGRVVLRELRARYVALNRLPAIKARTANEAAPQAVRRWIEVRVEGLDIETVAVDEEIAGLRWSMGVRSDDLGLDATGCFEGALELAGDIEGDLRFSGRLGEGIEAWRLAARLASRHLPGLERTSASVHAEGGVGRGRISCAIEVGGQTYATYGAEAAASWSTSNGQWSVDIDSAELSAWNTVRLSVSGRVASDRIALAGDVAAFDIAAIPLGGVELAGTARGHFSVEGPLEEPRMMAELGVDGFAGKGGVLEGLSDIDLRASAELGEGRLACKASVASGEGILLDGSLGLPCTVSLVPLPVRLSFHPEQLAGALDGFVDLGMLNRFAAMEEQQVDGRIDAALRYADQTPAGLVRLVDGSYEHFDLGVLCRDIDVELEATAEGLVVRHGSATDGNSGRLGLSGAVGMRSMDLLLDLSSAWVVHRPEIAARMSGPMRLQGTVVHPQLSGRLVVEKATVLPDNMVVARPRLLADFDASKPNDGGRSEGVAMLPLGIDLEIELADQVYVTASLIDSVWGGQLRLVNAQGPVEARGVLKPRRGFIDFIGKKFRLVQGSVVLDGGEPVLDQLVAEYVRGPVTARLVVGGRVTDPVFRLESIPPMPQDEVISHILFNRDTTTISPYQAYQIAAAARQLSEGLGGPGFMYQMRKAAGVDTLEIREAEYAGEASSIAAGKYITPAFYVEVNQTLELEGAAGMAAEYEVTPHISVETSTGPQMRPGVGVNWKYDY